MAPRSGTTTGRREPADGVAPCSDPQEHRVSRTLYLLVLAYLLLDYGRPQDTIPGLGIVRPAMFVTILLAVAYVSNREFWPKRSAQLYCVWAFLLLLAVHVPLARNNYYAYQTWFAMLLFLPLILALPTCLTSVSSLKRTIGFCTLLMAYQAGYAVLHGGTGTGSQFLDENDLSLFLNAYLPFAFFLFVAERRSIKKLLYLGGVLVALAGIVSTMSRGGFVGLLAVAAVTWLASPRKVLSLVVVALLAGGVYWSASEAYWARIATSTNAESGTARERVESWKAAWSMFKDNPMGVGGNNFQVRFSEYQGEYFQRGMWGRVAHSLWFTLISELGIPGALIYSVLLFYNLRDCLRIRTIGHKIGGDEGRLLLGLGSAFLASMAGFFASATFISVLYYPHYWYLTGFIVATAAIARTHELQAGAPV